MPERRHAIQAGVVIANMLSQPSCPIDDKGEHDIVEDAADQVLHQRLCMATITRQKSMSGQQLSNRPSNLGPTRSSSGKYVELVARLC